MSEAVRMFYRYTESHRPDVVHEVTFGHYFRDGGTTGEMCMAWYELQPGRLLAARLEVFDDAFQTLNDFMDVVVALKSFPDGISLNNFCDLLLSLGFAGASV